MTIAFCNNDLTCPHLCALTTGSPGHQGAQFATDHLICAVKVPSAVFNLQETKFFSVLQQWLSLTWQPDVKTHQVHCDVELLNKALAPLLGLLEFGECSAVGTLP